MFRSRLAPRLTTYRPHLEFLETRDLLSAFVVDRLTDSGEGSGMAGDLTYCINQAADGDRITFGVTGTILGYWGVSRSIRIEGPGVDLLTLAAAHPESGFYGPVLWVGGGATVSISGLTVANGNNSANAFDDGGGIHNEGTLAVSNSTISNNRADSGGGIANYGTLTLSDSTVSDNIATSGDGSWGGGIANYGTLDVINSTVSDNFGNNGGGIVNGWLVPTATLTVSNSTLSGNRAAHGGGIFNYGPLSLRNTILAGNSAPLFGPDLYGHLDSSGYNLIGNTQGGSGFDDTDLLDVNPLLGPLQDNGGPTQTMALLSGSPALNAGDPDQLGMPDQRGVLRTGGVNIGAYQASATAFVLSAPDTVDSGTPFDLTVTAVDPFGQPAYGYTGTVTFATTDPDPGVVLPADYTFTPDDQGSHTFSGGFTLITPGDQTLTATDASDDTIVGSATVMVTGGAGAPGRHRGTDCVDEFFAGLALGAPNAV
jgi:hypothetical protein